MFETIWDLYLYVEKIFQPKIKKSVSIYSVSRRSKALYDSFLLWKSKEDILSQQNNILVTPLHVSDYFFIEFIITLPVISPPTSNPVAFRCNLSSLPPSFFSSMVSSSLPTKTFYSSLNVEEAPDSLCTTFNILS